MNKPSRPLLVGPLLQSFFSEHLCSHKDASIQTIASYRDTFRLLLSYVQQTACIEPSALRITDLQVTVILAFLAHLEEQRRNSVRSRNIRLAAIRSFFRLVALRDPDSVGLAAQVLAIPIKRCDKPLVGYLTQPEMEAILAVPDLSLWIGQRDHALLLTMYNSGGRVSEITGLSWQQVRFGTTTYLDLNGKGRKERSVPLWPKTAKVLQQWRKRQSGSSASTIFPSLRGNVLTRDSVNHLLREIVQLAIPACPSPPGLQPQRLIWFGKSAFYSCIPARKLLVARTTPLPSLRPTRLLTGLLGLLEAGPLPGLKPLRKASDQSQTTGHLFSHSHPAGMQWFGDIQPRAPSLAHSQPR